MSRDKKKLPKEIKIRWYQERVGELTAEVWYSDGLAPYNITIERIGPRTYWYGSGGRWGKARSLRSAKTQSLLELIGRLADLGDKVRNLLGSASEMDD